MLGHDLSDSNRSTTLLDIVRQVRRRWRVKLVLRGAARFLAVIALVLIGSGFALESLRFSPESILAFRILLVVTVVGSAAWFIGRPLLRRVRDDQVALYLEEHEPSLEATIITAMEAEQAGHAHEMSPALVRRLVENAIERCQQIDDGRRVEQTPIRRYAAAAGIVTVVSLAVFLLGPAYLRQALSALLIISRDVEAAAPYKIEVAPGNATVPRGADQTISAKLLGFEAGEATLVLTKHSTAADAGAPGARTLRAGVAERVPMARAESGQYEGMLFDLSDPIEYFIEAAGVRSPVFNLKVIDLPYVKQLDLEYHFPSYTGLAPRTVEDGGDIAALRGTNVKLKITTTMAAKSGRILLEDGTATTLTPNADGTLAGEVAVAKQGFYRVELDSNAGEKVAASPQYTIDLLSDQTPSVTLSKPGRDTDATPVQEFFVEAKADDDFAVRDLQLVYSINGGEEKTLKLFDGKKPMPEVTAGHTFYLEELGVQPGDSVSYYARAMDNDTVEGPKRATSDIYFLRVRPFGKDFKPAMSMGGGGGGGGGAGAEVGALSQQQRQIIAGTFKVQRDRKAMGADKVREALVVLALSQSKLREQVQGLVDRMNSRLVTPDPSFKKIAEVLPLAAAEMKTAEGKLQQNSPDGALPPENKALQYLQQAEEEYELQVQTQRNAGGGGGGGGAGSIAEDLADLFKLELDRMANQYETSQRATAETAERQVDELAEKLKELARRQEQEIERQRRMASGQSPRSSADLQRALAEQAQEAARQLERLSREQNRPDLREAARQMQQAADAMRRAAGGDQSAAGQAASAAERLREAQRQLEGAQGARAEREVKDALRKAEEAVEEQRQISDDLKNLSGLGQQERSFKQQLLGERKGALQDKVANLEKQLDKAAGDISREARDASRKLQEAAGQIRDEKIKEKLQYSQRLMGGGGDQEYVRRLEDDISKNLDELRGTLREAERALGPGGRDRTAETLDKARELARGSESLGRRMQERAQERAGRNGQQGQQGREGQQQGQQGREGQQGQQGQSGQQGREGQQGQQGQSGQQGQGQAGQQGQSGQQGQQGQQGQSGQGGQQGGQNADGRGGNGDTTGPWREGGWGLGGDRRPGDYWFSPEDVRQFRGEISRFTADGRALREMLREQNLDTKDLDEILRRLRELEDTRVYRDIAELERLQTLVQEGLKRFEYDLRRKVGSDTDRALLSGADEVPPQFRKQVEEYYRALSKPGQQPPPRQQ